MKKYSLVYARGGNDALVGYCDSREEAEAKMEKMLEEKNLQVYDVVYRDYPHKHNQEFICDDHRNRFFINRVIVG